MNKYAVFQQNTMQYLNATGLFIVEVHTRHV